MGPAARPSVLLLTGRPGAGKTTVLRRAAERVGARVGGFYTEEIRAGGERRGFRGVPFDGGEASLIADVALRGGPRVGRYRVDVAAIDRLAETTLRPRAGVHVFFIDEIGKMECLSARFVAATTALLDTGRLVVATIGLRGSGFISDVKRRPDVELWEVTRTTRDALPERVVAWVRERLAL
ncbi:MAG TPA: nucleoside-triphosphatase [Vicinamibacterales bacterium]|nr:nucleoside-triphosphatase [Vicinamibacterales bacterium]